jgi:ubiquitin-protein ligase
MSELRRMMLAQNAKPLLENDYLVHFDENNLTKVHTLIKPPKDSVYKHKFIRLDFDIPEDYPHSPPKVTFINFDGVRIHPNFYEDGRCCSTILNTWGNSKFEKWTSSMGIETILLTFHSFLDNNPYMYEPGGRDDESYTVFVQYQSWHTCLVKYLHFEIIEQFRVFMTSYLMQNIDEIFRVLIELRNMYPFGYYYTKCFEIDDYVINYDSVIELLQYYYYHILASVPGSEDVSKEVTETEETNSQSQCQCNICFDTQALCIYGNTKCGHTFHKQCLKEHLEKNSNVCPLCRSELDNKDVDYWVINPQTKRKVKLGSRTYKYIVENKLVPSDE